jgi:hypothetical protein
VYDSSPAPGRIPVENGILGRRENPHKYLLYKPTLPQLQVFLASGYKGRSSKICLSVLPFLELSQSVLADILIFIANIF